MGNIRMRKDVVKLENKTSTRSLDTIRAEL